MASSAAFLLTGCARIGQQFKAQKVVTAYEAEHYNKNLYTGKLFASDLCVASENVALKGAPDPAGLHAAGLFDVEDRLWAGSDRAFIAGFVRDFPGSIGR